MGNGAILLAAGAGTRMQGATIDKILHPILGKPLFQYSLEAFLDSGMFSEIVIVYRKTNKKKLLSKLPKGHLRLKPNHLVSWRKGTYGFSPKWTRRLVGLSRPNLYPRLRPSNDKSLATP